MYPSMVEGWTQSPRPFWEGTIHQDPDFKILSHLNFFEFYYLRGVKISVNKLQASESPTYSHANNGNEERTEPVTPLTCPYISLHINVKKNHLSSKFVLPEVISFIFSSLEDRYVIFYAISSFLAKIIFRLSLHLY